MTTTDPSTWTLPRLRIDKDGAWFHDDEEVTHEGMLAELRSSLSRDSQGYYLRIGPVRVPVEVEDAPFVVLRAEPDGDRLVLTVNDLTREPLALDTLRFGADGVPYCRVKPEGFDARWSRAAAHQLFGSVQYDGPGTTANLVVGTRRYPLPGLETL
ncbi:MAG TPA: DUF1285 domain-containing protein [Candidatus Methylomirabilis sp.]|nr:DUF1285 domain-containing protein [Candidatus Methylomirabilis sp.]